MGWLEWTAQLAVAALLAGTIPVALKLERALRLVRSDRASLEGCAASLDEASRGAQAAAIRLRHDAERACREMENGVAAAEPLRDDLRYLLQRAEAVADRLDELVRTARAVLFPIRWDEPGGTAVVEALAAGVPVVAMRRGVLPELVDHGVTGWLADDEEEFAGYLTRVDELDREACRAVAERRFSPAAMAARYETFYRHVLHLAGRRRPRRAPALPAAVAG